MNEHELVSDHARQMFHIEELETALAARDARIAELEEKINNIMLHKLIALNSHPIGDLYDLYDYLDAVGDALNALAALREEREDG